MVAVNVLRSFCPQTLLFSSCREVSEPSAAAVTEVEPDSESSMDQQPASGAEPENSEGRHDEVRSLGGCRSLGLHLSPTNLHPHSYTSMLKYQYNLGMGHSKPTHPSVFTVSNVFSIFD